MELKERTNYPYQQYPVRYPYEIFRTVGHSATAFRNFAIRQLSIPQNDIRQRDQMAKIFRKK